VTVVFAFVYLPSFYCEINNAASCSKVAIPGEALKRKGETADKNKCLLNYEFQIGNVFLLAELVWEILFLVRPGIDINF
jgi:hypothetical protein